VLYLGTKVHDNDDMRPEKSFAIRATPSYSSDELILRFS
jgi:hypothetical protein